MSNHTTPQPAPAPPEPRPAPAPPEEPGFLDRYAGLLEWDGAKELLLDLSLFLLILALGFIIGRFLRWGYHRANPQAPTSGQLLLGKFLQFGLILMALGFGLTRIYHVDLVGLLAALGIVSLALGFGLQNTVANLAAGVGLTLDKPFDVGDRIRVGQTWGDVETIGLRSTRIMTVAGEHVIVPNSVLDTQEVWNYTHRRQSNLRLEVPIGISYGSSRPLAEHCMLEVARSDEAVLAYPEPSVLMRGFGDSSVDLELRVWIHQAQSRPRVIDRLLRGIQDAFNSEGVIFPFPQRTLSHLKDEEPAATPNYLEGDAGSKPLVLACIRGRPTAAGARRVVDFAERTESRLVVAHLRPPKAKLQEQSAQAAVNVVLEEALHRGVPARGRVEIGTVAQGLPRIAKATGAKMVILPDSFRRGNAPFHRNELRAARAAAKVPVVALDTSADLDERIVTHWHDRLQPKEELVAAHEGDVEAPKPDADEPGFPES